jgi:hypothetical protein
MMRQKSNAINLYQLGMMVTTTHKNDGLGMVYGIGYTTLLDFQTNPSNTFSSQTQNDM